MPLNIKTLQFTKKFLTKPFSQAAWILVLFSFLLSMAPYTASATEAYGRKTGKGCIFCHTESTGGQLKTVGFAYIRNGYQYPIPERILQKAEALQTPFQKSLRFIIGYLHLLAGVIFFGAIFYIHIFIRPTRLTGGIPKAERILGVSCMVTLTLTGVYLTYVRMDNWGQFFDNTFGLMLFIKICLFVVMVAIGITAITLIHRRMGAEAKTPLKEGAVSRSNIGYFDGTDGKPAYFIYQKDVYNVTNSEKWKEGRHFGKHAAGSDLTAALEGAPHGPEVFDRIQQVGDVAASDATHASVRPAQKIFIWMAYTNLVIIFLILSCISVWRWDFPFRLIPEQRVEALVSQTCVDCHRQKTPGVHKDWQNSVHAKVNVGCVKCHRPNTKSAILKSHLQHTDKPVSVVVSPTNCGGCHPKQAEEYNRSKHANTHAIMWQVDHWLNDRMNNAIELASGCFACHGTIVAVVDGRPAAGTWPNVGVGRINPDGSKGSCSSCHTRHRFSVVEARKPEACDQCHLGPDHPQIEIYNESKHGTIYHAEGHEWEWGANSRSWQAGIHYRAPTCATCHMSAAGDIPASHDVTERLSWETQAPRTVHPNEFKPFPASTDWKFERNKMKSVCLQCHATTWTEEHFRNFDAVVTNYNELYYDPIKALFDDLKQSGLVAGKPYFDEEIEWQFYEFWHHEGRRARMGTAMMAPDYAWWHGFYELKHRYLHLLDLAAKLQEKGNADLSAHFPGRFDANAQSKE
jgi:predicted heme/steroid binding protein